MAHFTERLQVLLSPEELGLLKQISRQNNKSVNEVVRQAIQQSYQPGNSVEGLYVLSGMEKARLHDAPAAAIVEFCRGL